MGCEYVVLDPVEGIRRDIAEGRIVRVGFNDFTPAFNCIFGSVIIEQSVGFSVAAARVIADSFTGRSFRVVSGTCISDWRFYHRGIGQGGRLGPLFYILAANTYPRALSCCSPCHLLAHDSTVEHVCRVEALPSAMVDFQADFLSVEEWCVSTGLVLNPRKVRFMCFGSASAVAAVRKQRPEIRVVTGGEVLGSLAHRGSSIGPAGKGSRREMFRCNQGGDPV